MRERRLFVILAVVALAAPSSGCLSNMAELKAALGFVPPPPPPAPDPLPPVAVAEANLTLTAVGSPVRFSAEGSRDPDGALVAWAWSFGDGRSTAGATSSHAFATPGEFVVRLIVTDDAGLTATDQVTVTVRASNRAPEAEVRVVDAKGRDVERGEVGVALGFDATLSRDPEGGALEYAWDFGDGETSLQPISKHTFRAPGQYLVTLVVRDALGASARATRLVAAGGNVTYPTGEFGATSVSEASHDLALRVPEGAARVEVTLRFSANFGVADLGVRLLAPGGAEVARVAPESASASPRDVAKTISATREMLDAHAPGEWTIVVEKGSGFGVAYDVSAAIVY